MKPNEVSVTKVVGDEWDEALKARLLATLREMGGKQVRYLSGLGGSQELGVMVIALDSQEVQIESETYVGLSICGERSLIDRIVKRLEAMPTL